MICPADQLILPNRQYITCLIRAPSYLAQVDPVLLQVNPEAFRKTDEIVDVDPHDLKIRIEEMFIDLPFSLHPVK
jgi:hypothetical protein